MFVYTVYGAPGVTPKAPTRRVEAVDEIEGVTQVGRSWTVRRDRAGLPAQSEGATGSLSTYEKMADALARANDQGTQAPRMGDVQIQVDSSVVLKHRGAKSLLNPNFSRAMDQLRSMYSDANTEPTDHLSTTVKEALLFGAVSV